MKRATQSVGAAQAVPFLDQTYFPTALVYSDLIVLGYTFLGIPYPFFQIFNIGIPTPSFQLPAQYR